MKTTAPGPIYPPIGSSPWPIPYEDFRRFHEAGITGSTARFHDREADRLDVLERRHERLVRFVRLMAFGIGALLVALAALRR